MKRLASLLLALSLLAALTLPAIEPTYSALAQDDGSVVSGQDGDQSSEPPTDVPTDVPPPTDIPAPTDVPPTEVPPPTDVPPTDIPAPTNTSVPVVPAEDTETATATITLTASSTPYVAQIGDLVQANANVNCREMPSSSALVKTTVSRNSQVFVISGEVIANSYVWIQVQLQDPLTTQCYVVKSYFSLVSSGNTVPSTVTPTLTPSATRTPSTTPTNSATPTKTVTRTVTSTPTKTATRTGSETATPYKNLQVGDLVATTTRVNCRTTASTSSGVVKVVQIGDQGVIISPPVRSGSYDWVGIQLLDATTTQCFIAAQFLNLVQAGHGIPPTVTSTPTITNTPTLTPTKTATNTPTQTPTLTGSETATFTPSVTNTPTETLTPTQTLTPTETYTPSITPSASVTNTPTFNDLHAGDLVKATQSINCRVSYSAQANISWIMNQNDKAVLLTDPVDINNYNWVKVRPLGRTVECYVAAQYLTLVQSGYGLSPTPTATASGTVTTTAGPYNIGDIIKTTSSVNLRTDAGTSFPLVATIAANTQGTVMAGFKNANGLDWVQVQFPTASGWVAVKYTTKVTSSTPGGPFAAGTQVVVTSTVNLRTAPGTSNPSLGQLTAGMQGLALGVQAKVGSATWVQVEFAVGTGWVDASYLKKLTSVTPTVGPTAANIWVYLDCTANPERVIVQNNNLQSIKVISIGSTYQPGAGEPFAVGDTLGTKVTLSYESNSNASGAQKLTSREIFDNNVGAQEGVVVKTNLGDISASCPAVTIGEKWIEVNLTTQTLYVYRGSTIISSSLVSTGKPGFETPTGTFKIIAKYESVTMAACANGECWNTPGVPWDMLFRDGGFYLHGAYWHHDFGKVRSHGCVNLPVPYAEWLYSWAPIGTRVWIHY